MFLLTPVALESLASLALGLAFAGLLASAFELFTARRASFKLLQTGDAKAIASAPLLVFCAPFIILRNTLAGRRVEGRPFVFVMLATMLACVWGMLCGRLVLDVALGLAGQL